MRGLPANETRAIERARSSPMLARVRQWAAVNSGTGNLAGLASVAEMLADAFSCMAATSISRCGPARRCDCC